MNIDEYQKQAALTAIYPENCKISYPALGLCGETGEIANKVKKIFRDKNGILDEITRVNLMGELGDVTWYLAALATDLDLKLSDILEYNLKKLNDRKDRGVLVGEGDNR